MLQKKDYQQQPTIKKPIVENQTSGKIKTNVTKEGIPTTNKHQQRYQETPTKIPVTPTKIPVTPTIKNVQKKTIPTKNNVTKEGLPTTTTIKIPIVENQTYR